MRITRCFALATAAAATVAGAGLAASAPALATPRTQVSPARQARQAFLRKFHHTKLIASTVPGNADVNPYGVAVVRHSQGRLTRGDVLISNFNNAKKQQGTGSTIVEVSPSGHRIVFAEIARNGLPGACPGGIGLTTALVIVHGWVIVGSLPS